GQPPEAEVVARIGAHRELLAAGARLRGRGKARHVDVSPGVVVVPAVREDRVEVERGAEKDARVGRDRVRVRVGLSEATVDVALDRGVAERRPEDELREHPVVRAGGDAEGVELEAWLAAAPPPGRRAPPP